MIADSYQDVVLNSIDLSKLQPTRAVRNFLLDNLFEGDILLSYAPSFEFGSNKTFGWFMGGHICDYDAVNNTIAPRQKINYRVIRILFEAGVIQVKRNIESPHNRCIIFEWAEGLEKYKREILLTKMFAKNFGLRHELINNTAALYGLKINYLGSRGIFEVTKASGEPIESKAGSKTISNTYLLINESGNPVTKLRDMGYHEWERHLHDIAVRAKTLGSPVSVHGGYFTSFKRN